MTDTPTETFEERINLLFRELQMALRFDRPSILLAIYQSEYVRADAEAALAERLLELGQTTQRVFINEENHDLPVYLREQADRATTVYFVSGVRFGGGKDGRNAYRVLNIRREYFVDDKLRVIFWLTEKEAFYLPRYAPDFWAFRHRTVEFMDAPNADKIRKHTHDLVWRGWQGEMTSDTRVFTEDTAAKIAYRKRMLDELPDTPETTETRANLTVTLGPLYLAQGEYEKAIAAFQQAIELDPKDALPPNGLGNVYGQLGRVGEAISSFQQAIQLDPKNASLHTGLGNVYADLGSTNEAIAAYQRAIKLGPRDTTPRIGLGNLYRQLGRTDDAISAYQQAIALNPDFGEPYLNLAWISMLQEQPEVALTYLQKGLALAPQHRQLVADNLGFEMLHDDLRFQALVGDSRAAV